MQLEEQFQSLLAAYQHNPMDPITQYCLALCYEFGLGTSFDPIKANQIYENFLANDGVGKIKNLANINNPDALFILGHLHELGKNERTIKDIDSAIEFYRQAAEQGHVFAMYRLATLYYSVIEQNQFPEQALFWYSNAAELKFAPAQYLMGEFYSQGNVLPQDTHKAILCYYNAAILGHDLAQNKLVKLIEQLPASLRKFNDSVIGLFQLYQRPLYETKKVKKGRLLGEGAYSKVRLGNLHDKAVAIKQLKKFTKKAKTNFINESTNYLLLSHPRIVALHGAMLGKKTCGIILEYMEQGALNEKLQTPRLSAWRAKLRVARDVAEAMKYMHQQGILNLDLKSRNILLQEKNSKLRAKLADFGLSMFKWQAKLNPKGLKGSPCWMAPELFQRNIEEYNEAVDVYAFGIVLWEIVTGECPEYHFQDLKQLMRSVISGQRLSIPSDVPASLSELIQQCWHQDPKLRPAFDEIVETLKNIHAQYKPIPADQHISVKQLTSSIHSYFAQRDRGWTLLPIPAQNNQCGYGM